MYHVDLLMFVLFSLGLCYFNLNRCSLKVPLLFLPAEVLQLDSSIHDILQLSSASLESSKISVIVNFSVIKLVTMGGKQKDLYGKASSYQGNSKHDTNQKASSKLDFSL